MSNGKGMIDARILLMIAMFNIHIKSNRWPICPLVVVLPFIQLFAIQEDHRNTQLNRTAAVVNLRSNLFQLRSLGTKHLLFLGVQIIP